MPGTKIILTTPLCSLAQEILTAFVSNKMRKFVRGLHFVLCSMCVVWEALSLYYLICLQHHN